MRTFDVCGPLPTGTVVLEASAGTGKTFTIAALTARYVAEGRAGLDELLLVTFGRAATAELRQRVRERLVGAERGLADPAAARASGDRVLALLADADPAEVAARRRRLTEAVGDFDAATICTVHQFCARILGGLGIVGDSDPVAAFVEDLDDLITEVVDDLYVRRYATPGAPVPAFSRSAALTLARQAVGDGQARLEPAGADPDTPAGVRQRFAAAVRSEVDRRKRGRHLYCYDDLLVTLQRALRSPEARRRLRERFAVVLVDEFQDTDPVQWDIVRTAFHGHPALVLIGDPKQAIYGFRGADVTSYLTATGTQPSTRATLGTNWRSDERVLTALETVFNGAALGDPRITVRPVGAAHPDPRLPHLPPFRLRVLSRAGLPLTRAGLASAGAARDAVTADLTRELVALLDSGTKPGDVAVLVRTNRQSTQIIQALSGCGVPAVLAGAASVFTTSAARDWLTLLQALEQPHRRTRVAAAALTALIGVPAADLATADLDHLSTTLRHWAALLETRGVAALLEAITATGLPERLLARRTGERQLTDLRHVGTAMHAAAVEGRLGLAAVAEWLRRRIDEAPGDLTPERGRRLESDADAVQVVTVHGSKGLEYPVVYLPFGWDRYVGEPDLLSLHDDAGDRVLDVGGAAGPDFADHLRRHRAEEDAEDLRLLYVALTRAACQVVAWWAPTSNTRASALHRLLFGRPAPGENPRHDYPVPADAAALAALSALDLTVEPVAGPPAPARWQAPGPDRPTPAAARLTRRFDHGWRRTSYSRLTAGRHEGPGVRSETAELDEPVTTPAGDSGTGPRSPMADLPAGAAFGTLVHALLEDTDLAAPDLQRRLTAKAATLIGPAALDPAELATALLPALHTPLGPLAGDRRLVDVARADRLDELEFELPLHGGDRPRPGSSGTLSRIGTLLAEHLGPDDPLHPYAERLHHPELGAQPLRGYLTGSIDSVLRLPHGYVVVDYKTNRLGTHSGDYRAAALGPAMITADYPLQALLYSVALHRYLRWRQPGYDPAVHLGGVLYLFLRGMCGPEAPHGVFGWRPPPALVAELSELL